MLFCCCLQQQSCLQRKCYYKLCSRGKYACREQTTILIEFNLQCKKCTFLFNNCIYLPVALNKTMNHELFNESRWFHRLPSIRYTYALSNTLANSCDSVSKMAPLLDPGLESDLLSNMWWLWVKPCSYLWLRSSIRGRFVVPGSAAQITTSDGPCL